MILGGFAPLPDQSARQGAGKYSQAIESVWQNGSGVSAAKFSSQLKQRDAMVGCFRTAFLGSRRGMKRQK
jgi:hypothetical protein